MLGRRNIVLSQSDELNPCTRTSRRYSSGTRFARMWIAPLAWRAVSRMVQYPDAFTHSLDAEAARRTPILSRIPRRDADCYDPRTGRRESDRCRVKRRMRIARGMLESRCDPEAGRVGPHGARGRTHPMLTRGCDRGEEFRHADTPHGVEGHAPARLDSVQLVTWQSVSRYRQAPRAALHGRHYVSADEGRDGGHGMIGADGSERALLPPRGYASIRFHCGPAASRTSSK
jgi:hypothetical protein